MSRFVIRSFLDTIKKEKDRKIFFMKSINMQKNQRLVQCGFTLVELLVVIGIISILAAMLLPALSGAKDSAKKAQAKTEMQNIAGAVRQYNAEYNRYPIPPQISKTLTAASPDYTFGTMHMTGSRSKLLKNNKGESLPKIASSGRLQISNAEVVAILQGVEAFRNGRQTSNRNNKLNSRKVMFLNAKNATNTQPGVGLDGVYRDPWGNPYIVSVDGNYDGKVIDAFYGRSGVSAGGDGEGLNGLVKVKGGYQANTPVMVWSLGSDGLASSDEKSNVGVNDDNILSWQ